MPVEIVGVQMTEIERLLHPDTEQVALFPGVAGRAIVTHRKGVKGTGLICHRHIESHPDGVDPGIAGRLEVDVVLTVTGEFVAEHRRFAHTVPSRNESRVESQHNRASHDGLVADSGRGIDDPPSHVKAEGHHIPVLPYPGH